MKYKAFITNGEEHKVMDVDANIFESNAFDYGNRKAMSLKINGNDNLYDIRYDTRYDGNNRKYIENAINEYWNGENGAWKLEKLERVYDFACISLIDSWIALGHTLEEMAEDEMPKVFLNEDDEKQIVSVNNDITQIVVQTIQKNGWFRTNIYYDDGNCEELFEK